MTDFIPSPIGIQWDLTTSKALYDSTEKKLIAVKECSHCVGITPKNVQVVFSGITLCGCIAERCITGNCLYIGDFNVTRTLPFYRREIYPDACFWSEYYQETNPITIIRREYEGDECTGNYTQKSLIYYPIVSLSEANYIFVRFHSDNEISPGWEGEFPFLYYALYTGEDCVGGTFLNEYTAGQCGTIDSYEYLVIGHGGQCVVTKL